MHRWESLSLFDGGTRGKSVGGSEFRAPRGRFLVPGSEFRVNRGVTSDK